MYMDLTNFFEGLESTEKLQSNNWHIANIYFTFTLTTDAVKFLASYMYSIKPPNSIVNYGHQHTWQCKLAGEIILI